MHATGLYPGWWEGLRLTKPKLIWVAGVSLATIRGALMKAYLGATNELEFGTGFIPKDRILDYQKQTNGGGAVDYVNVRHKLGHTVTIMFKSYEQSREKYQSDKVDFIHLDEEPPEGIFAECAARIMGTGGGMIITATPLKGVTEVCLKFMEPDETIDKYYGYVQASIEDNPYISTEEKEKAIAGYEPHLREARIKGIPALGSGLIYPFHEDEYLVDPFPIPEHWNHTYAIDFGLKNTAAVIAAVNPETGVVYVYHTYKAGDVSYVEHTSVLKELKCGKMHGVCDPAGRAGSPVDGQALLKLYQDEGLLIDPADNTVNAGIMRCYQMFRAGRLKIFNSPETDALRREIRKYHRNEEGKIVKKDDHACDAMRYLIMSGLDVARPLNAKMFRGEDVFRSRRKSNWLTT